MWVIEYCELRHKHNNHRAREVRDGHHNNPSHTGNTQTGVLDEIVIVITEVILQSLPA